MMPYFWQLFGIKHFGRQFEAAFVSDIYYEALCFGLAFGKVLQLHYIVHFGSHLEITDPNIIDAEPLFVRGIISL